MYTTIIHPIRKALCLSIEEYVVLDTIYHLCNNEKYGHWCIMTKEKLAECLDLSRRTIFRIINTLESKNLIIRDEATNHLKTKDNFNEMIANKHDWIIGFKGKENALISGKVDLSCQIGTDSAKMTSPQCQNGTLDSAKLARNNNKDNNKDNNKEIYKEKKTGRSKPPTMTEEDWVVYWESVPNKKGRAVAYKVFMRLDRGLLPVILSALKEQKNCKQWREGFIPNPATWINQQRWEDEITMSQKDYEDEFERLGYAAFCNVYGMDKGMEISNNYL